MADNSSTSSFSVIKTLAKELAIIIGIIILLDFLIGSGLRYLYFNQESGNNYKTIYAIEQSDEDVLIFGTSIGIQNFNPELIEKELDVSCYNASRHGQSIFYYLGVQKAILERYSPKLFIVDFDPTDLYENTAHNDRLNVLLPYYRSHDEIRDVIDFKGPYERAKLLGQIYPFNGEFLNMIKNHRPERIFIKGHLPANKVITQERVDAFYKDNYKKMMKRWNQKSIDEEKITALRELIKNARNKNVELVFTISPLLIRFDEIESVVKLKEICEELKVPIFDYKTDERFTRLEYFHDMSHMNKDGAVQLTADVIKQIKNLNLIKD